MDSRPTSLARLRQEVEWALRRAIDPVEVLPMLHRLARGAADGSDESVFAHRNLAELLVERDPWRAALHVRRVLQHRSDDGRAWAMLGLCQTLLGHYRYAAKAYTRALDRSPDNPWYAHNLGHLLDVALDQPRAAVTLLGAAYAGAAWSPEISASYAHALARVGDLPSAKKVVARALKRGSSRELSALAAWLDEGAPAGKDKPAPRTGTPDRIPRLSVGGRRPPSAQAVRALASELDAVLSRGLGSLPLDARQRSRARELARDALFHFVAHRAGPRGVRAPVDPPGPRLRRDSRGAGGATEDAAVVRTSGSVFSLAGAIAYAIVYVDHVPLTQAEVAACFRVSVASVRARFGELRAVLDLKQGDTRYATQRQR